MKKTLCMLFITGLLPSNCYADVLGLPTVAYNRDCRPLAGDNFAGCFTNKTDHDLIGKVSMWVEVVSKFGYAGNRYFVPWLQINYSTLVSISNNEIAEHDIVSISASLDGMNGKQIDGCHFMMYPNTSSIQNINVTESNGHLTCLN